MIPEPLFFKDNLLQTGDYNNDGAIDFMFKANKVPKVYKYYLYDKKTGLFELAGKTGENRVRVTI